MRSIRLVALVALVAVLSAWPGHDGPPRADAQQLPGEAIAIAAAPADPLLDDERQAPRPARIGKLRFASGFAMKSPDSRFGGVSGIAMLEGGRTALVVTDAGDWMAWTLRRDGCQLVGIDSGRIGRLADEPGRPLGTRKRDSDAEEIACLWPGQCLVAYERRHRIMAIANPWEKLRPGTLLGPQAVPDLASAPANDGIEAMAWTGDRALALAEGMPAGPDRIAGWVGTPCAGCAPARLDWQRLAYAVDAGFKPTGATGLPAGRAGGSGDVLVLERRFKPPVFVAARIRRLDGSRIVAGGDLQASPVAELWPPRRVDNFEGIAAWSCNGSTHVAIVSDDNFSPLQETLLYEFVLEE
ncbi:MAG: esterase-like activity of phytase family protein [Alphaproteobacteria bacterium]|nr:esterase-like activity of phytase family protein [Alphaproteobacteria bacterium]